MGEIDKKALPIFGTELGLKATALVRLILGGHKIMVRIHDHGARRLSGMAGSSRLSSPVE